MLFPNTNRIFASLLKNKANEGELVAQQVEHIPFKDGVLGSSPNWLTKAVKIFLDRFFYAKMRTLTETPPTQTKKNLPQTP